VVAPREARERRSGGAAGVKVLHVVYGFPPDPSGGTEVYVDALCRSLLSRSIACTVAAPGPVERQYDHHGLPVRRFACAPDSQSLDVLYGAGDATAAASFGRVLDLVRPDVVHQHAVSPACSAALPRLARARGLPVVLTYHTPAVSCQRGTLLRFGRAQCSGAIDTEPCMACVLDDLGLNEPLRRAVGALPAAAGRALGRWGLAGGVWTALRVPALMDVRRHETHALFALADRIVAPTSWVATLLEANGVPRDRIVSSRHGIAGRTPRVAARETLPGTVRFVHIGRLDPAKGTELLLRAFSAVRASHATLDVFGLVQHDADMRHVDALRQLAGRDTRVRLLPAMPHDDVIATLAGYDALIVPSQWMETGPLVVLEAFDAGVPVIGSALGGLADKVVPDVNGLLVSPFDEPSAWTRALELCVNEPGLLARLARGVTAPRTMDDVALEMVALYRELAPCAREASAT
jgi:glycosyltransferase involved in cell wall biosynthesis